MALLIATANLRGGGRISVETQNNLNAAAVCTAKATINAAPGLIMETGAGLVSIAGIATGSVIPSPTTAVQIITIDAMGNPVAGTIRAGHRVVGAINPALYVPIIGETFSNGDVTITIPTSIEADYYFTPSGQLLAYHLGRIAVTAPGLLGSIIRTDVGQQVGAQSYSPVSGTILARTGAPAIKPRIATVGVAITRDGSFVIPVQTEIALTAQGGYEIALPQTDELYSPEGAVKLRLTDGRGRRIGQGDFVVPASAGLTFAVVDGNLELV